MFLQELLSSDQESTQSQGVVEHFSELSFPTGFVLLTIIYHDKKKQILAVVIIILALLFAIYRARRGLIFMYSNIVIFSYILFFLKSTKKVVIAFLTIFVILLLALYFSGSSSYKIKESNLFGFVLERGDENTRENVELNFFDDMKETDWIIGRGLNGSYFCPSVDEIQPTNQRYVIETGYLHSVLKGGLLYVFLLLIITIPAIVLGLFFSKNVLSKAAAIWILMALINLYPAPVIKFSLQYMLVWISVAICYSSYIRKIPDSSLISYFRES